MHEITMFFEIRQSNSMIVNSDSFIELHKPYYVVEEKLLRRNLKLIAEVAKRADVEIILAFKAFALWKTFDIFREYIRSTTASSLSEALLAYNEFGAKPHTYSPAYTDYEIDDIARCSSHISFNSFSQYERYAKRVKGINKDIEMGIRINPRYSEVETMLYNPCAPGTRFGVSSEQMPDVLPEGISGFHCHCHCESGPEVFERTLVHIERNFSKWFSQIKWINFGGGHLMTRKDYDTEKLVSILKDFKKRYPHLHVILEPGSAFAWQTGPLVSQVVDIVEDKGIKTAILNVSFTCHMPDCLEMPYHPQVRGAETIEDNGMCVSNMDKDKYVYRLGGNSCLSGDYMSAWSFDHELSVGENVIFEDMIHYTTVKTNTFNGITHPSIALLRENGEFVVLREYGYEDYKSRMD